MASQGLASALAVLALIAVTEAQTCGTKGGGRVSVPGSRGGDSGDSCDNCGPRPCVNGDTCYSCCTNPDASGTIHLYPYYCPSGPNTFQCSNSPCQSPSPPPSSSRRRSPPPPPPPPPSSSRRRSAPPPPSGGQANQGYDLFDGDFDLSALLDIEVPRALTVPLGLFGIIAGAVMGTHG